MRGRSTPSGTRAGADLSDWAQGLLDSDVADARYELDEALLAQLSGRDETSELLAVARMRPDDLARIPAPADAPVVVFDRPVSPGNLGSVVRCADTLGATGVVVTGHAADVYDPQAVRASVGSLFAIPVVRAPAMSDVRVWIERLRHDVPGVRVVGSSARGATSIDGADLSRPALVVLGNETRGLSTAWRDLSDELVVIPMRRDGTSLNAAAAAAILLYEVRRQRVAGRPAAPRQRA
jgi:23S rRNA (uridine2479-2'-O)-methyltransferase